MKIGFFGKLLVVLVGGFVACVVAFCAMIQYIAYNNCHITYRKAINGDAQSQRVLATGYDRGNLESYSMGVISRDEGKAIYWYKRSFQSGCSEAGAYLAELYERKHTPAGNARALQWYGKAALAGEKDAAAYLTRVYLYGGLGQGKDATKARYWKKVSQK